MRKLLKQVFLITALALPLMVSAQVKKPNIIFILCDDMGFGDVGFNGSKLNRTPNLDLLAKEGALFTDCYAAANVCSPSRAALLTGQYPIRTGIVDVIHPPSSIGITNNSVTMAEMLKDAGYYTGMVGKWHLGDAKENLPLQHGFQEYFGIPYSNDMRPCIYLRGNEVESTKVDQTQLTKTYLKESIKFIEKNNKRPFFLYLAHNMPHTPLFASDQFKGKSKNGLYGDVIEELDWSVGELMKKLRELKLEKNTLIVFSSDNGPWLKQGKNAGSPLPFFQGKFTTWEGGHRVPTFAYWKGTIKPAVNNEVCSLMDWMPTFANIANAKLPNDRVIDGHDLTSVLINNATVKEEEFCFFIGKNIKAYRIGNYKLILPAPVFKGFDVFPDVPAHGVVLFDLSKDVAETTDISKSNPDIVAKITARIGEFQNSINGLEVQRNSIIKEKNNPVNKKLIE